MLSTLYTRISQAACLTVFLTGSPAHGFIIQNSPADILKVSVRTDKQIYKRGETIQLDVFLTNTGDRLIHIYNYLSWGYSSSLTLHVYNHAGKEVQARFLDDTITPPPPPEEDYYFVSLKPNHLFGVRRTSPLEELNINQPGQYKIIVEYHSPIPKKYGKEKEIVGTEDGRIWSKPVRIKVVASKR